MLQANKRFSLTCSLSLSLPRSLFTETMTQATTTDLEALKKSRSKRLNSKAGQMKMDLHDIAEGLPADLEQLPDAAARTYDIFCQLRDLKQQLKTLEQDQ